MYKPNTIPQFHLDIICSPSTSEFSDFLFFMFSHFRIFINFANHFPFFKAIILVVAENANSLIETFSLANSESHFLIFYKSWWCGRHVLQRRRTQQRSCDMRRSYVCASDTGKRSHAYTISLEELSNTVAQLSLLGRSDNLIFSIVDVINNYISYEKVKGANCRQETIAYTSSIFR